MRKALLFLFIGMSVNAFAQHPCTPPIVNIIDSGYMCAGNQYVIYTTVSGANPPFTYLWNIGATTSSITVSPVDTFNYSVTVKNSCGDSTTKSILITPNYLLLYSCCNSNISLGDSVILLAGGNSATYQWSPSVHCLNPPLCDTVMATPTVTTTYTLIGTDSAGCQAEQYITITVGPAGVPSLSGTDFINVYPNPSTTAFTVTLQTKALLQVCDITGHIIYSQMENAGNITFGKELNTGIYFLFIDGKPGVKLVKL